MRVTRPLAPLAAALLLVAPAAPAAPSTDWRAKVDPEILLQVDAGHSAEVVARMATSAGLLHAEALTAKADKGRFVFETLSAHAADSQRGLRTLLQGLGVSHRSFWIANVVSFRGDLATVRTVALRDDVAQVHGIGGIALARPVAAPVAEAKTRHRGGIAEGLKRVGAPEVWALGYRGQGVVVADHDIGVKWDHPALKATYLGWDGATADHAYHWHNAFDADPFCPDPEVPCDSHGHGTHTTGTMVGDDGRGNQIGMAPDARWIACRSLYDPIVGVGTVPSYLECMEWTLAPYPGNATIAADPDRAPDIVNNSWGCVEGCPFDVLRDTNDAIKAAGILQVVSAGNDGSDCSTIAFPLALYDSSFTVGATDMRDGMAGFSSRGPVLTDLSLRIKPDVVAPGVDVRSSLDDNGYGELSGTSMAAPHVAGLAALILSANPALRGRVDELRAIIERSAVPVRFAETCGGTTDADLPNNTAGHGRIDAVAAVALATGSSVEKSRLRIAGGAPAVAVLMLLALGLLRRRG